MALKEKGIAGLGLGNTDWFAVSMALFQEGTLGVKGRCQMNNEQEFKALSQSFLPVAKAASIMAAENVKTQ